MLASPACPLVHATLTKSEYISILSDAFVFELTEVPSCAFTHNVPANIIVKINFFINCFFVFYLTLMDFQLLLLIFLMIGFINVKERSLAPLLFFCVTSV